MENYTVENHFTRTEPLVRDIYETLLDNLRTFGEVHEAPKKGSIHLDNASGFAGVYTRKNYINLHFRLSHKLEHERIMKVEQLSSRRFKHTVKLQTKEDVDPTLLEWLKEAYELAG